MIDDESLMIFSFHLFRKVDEQQRLKHCKKKVIPAANLIKALWMYHSRNKSWFSNIKQVTYQITLTNLV